MYSILIIPIQKRIKGIAFLPLTVLQSICQEIQIQTALCATRVLQKVYNQLHVTPLYDVLNKIYVHCVIQPQPKQDEVGSLRFILDWYGVQKKTLFVADRGFESYNLLAHFMAKKVDFLIRVKQERKTVDEKYCEIY